MRSELYVVPAARGSAGLCAKRLQMKHATFWSVGRALRKEDGEDVTSLRARALMASEGRRAVDCALWNLYLAALELAPDQADAILATVVASGFPTLRGVSHAVVRRWIATLPVWAVSVLTARWERAGLVRGKRTHGRHMPRSPQKHDEAHTTYAALPGDCFDQHATER